jgi:hypothetical protein
MTCKGHFFINKKLGIRGRMNTNITDFSSRESLLQANSALIAQLQTRLKTKRWKVSEGENLKVAYYRVLVQALQCQNAILKDTELDDLKKEIDDLKELIKCRE